LPAVLGASLAGRHSGRRSIVLVGDGAAQMTIQEISTIVRYRANPIIILFNNFGYQIEEVLHAGPYNLISNWQYHKLVDCFTSTTDRESADGVVSALATTEDELCQALVQAETGKSKDRLVFIETRIRPNDVSDLLLRFGVTAGKWNGRPMAAGLNEGFQMNLMVGL
jgi:TPP-dependent 2-oxoacid decarboxylase